MPSFSLFVLNSALATVTRPDTRLAKWRSRSPERSRGQLRALRQHLQLCPGDIRMHAAAQAAICAGDDVFSAHQTRKTRDSFGDQVRMLHHIGRVADDARNKNLAVGQLDVLPNTPLVLVPRVRGFDRVCPGMHGKQEVHDVPQWNVGRMRSAPAAPTDVVPHTLLGHAAQLMVYGLNSQRSVFLVLLHADRRVP